MALQPPTPIMPTSLPSDLSGLSWTAASPSVYNAAGAQLGHFADGAGLTHYLVFGHGSSADGAWAVETSPNGGTTGLLFTSADAAVMQGATVNGNGSLTYNHATFWGQVFFDATAGFIAQLHQQPG